VCEAIAVVTPMEGLKTRLIDDMRSPAENRKYRGLFHGISVIVRTEGIVGIYHGLTATIIKQGSNQAVRFLVFQKVKDKVQHFTGQAPGVVATALCGGVAGAVSVFANNPVDVVKTKMQGLERPLFKNSFDCARKIFIQQGPLFFYRGVTPRLVRVCGDAAITFSMYAQFSKLYWSLRGTKPPS